MLPPSFPNDLYTGLPEVDKDHEAILYALEHLVVSEERDLSIRILIDYVTMHCLREEAAMRKSKYPNLHRHEHSHRAIQSLFVEVMPLLLIGPPESVIASKKLKQHFLQHVFLEDTAMAKYLIDNKIKFEDALPNQQLDNIQLTRDR